MSKVVLMYHDVVYEHDISGFQVDSAFQYKVSVLDFENQVKLLQNTNVEFTFDDGGVSFLTRIASILEKYNKRGIFFISTKYIDTPGFLTRDNIVELVQRGHIIGSHAHTHANMAKLTSEEILSEWKLSIDILSDIIGVPITVASIPNGYKSRDVLKYAHQCGIRKLYTSDQTTKISYYQNMQIIGRYVVHNNTPTDFVCDIVQKKHIRLRLFIKWWVLNCIKSILGDEGYSQLKSKIVK